jgi:hypothetical protein
MEWVLIVKERPKGLQSLKDFLALEPLKLQIIANDKTTEIISK